MDLPAIDVRGTTPDEPTPFHATQLFHRSAPQRSDTIADLPLNQPVALLERTRIMPNTACPCTQKRLDYLVCDRINSSGPMF
jgi:hypothetical protein